MRSFWSDVDGLLRGRLTTAESLQEGGLKLKTSVLAKAAISLALIYGLFLGLYGALRPQGADLMQLVASTLKFPCLFVLTLLVTLPSLYVLFALKDCRVSFREMIRFLLAAVVIDVALLASLGPVTGFFTLSTDSYPFLVLLNVVFCAVAGGASLVFLRRALNALLQPLAADLPIEEPIAPEAPDAPKAPEAPEGPEAPATAIARDLRALIEKPIFVRKRRLESQDDPRQVVFRGWIVVYAVVGLQMSWILRPFIGTPALPFEWFRERESNAFMAVLRALGQLMAS